MYYADLKKVNKLLTYAIMLFKKKGGWGGEILCQSAIKSDALLVAYIQFVAMLIGLQQVLS